MKPFNLTEAIQGKPVLLRDGSKAYVLGSLLNCGFNSKDISYPLRGIIIYDNNAYWGDCSWTLEGKYDKSDSEHKLSIIGMYNEPKLSSKEVLEKSYKESVSISLKSDKDYQNTVVIGKTYTNEYIVLSKNGNVPLITNGEFFEWELHEPSKESQEEVILE